MFHKFSCIFNAGVCDNILFGSSFESSRYQSGIDVTALGHDLDLLPGGHQTEIGDRGVNISGGQKQKVSMARAVYSNSDVYIFDDPSSALDAHVARQLAAECIFCWHILALLRVVHRMTGGTDREFTIPRLVKLLFLVKLCLCFLWQRNFGLGLKILCSTGLLMLTGLLERLNIPH